MIFKLNRKVKFFVRSDKMAWYSKSKAISRHFKLFKPLWTFFTLTPCDSNWLEVVQSGTISSAWWQIGTNVTGKWTIIMNGLETANSSSRALWKICHHLLLSKSYSEKPRQHIKNQRLCHVRTQQCYWRVAIASIIYKIIDEICVIAESHFSF